MKNLILLILLLAFATYTYAGGEVTTKTHIGRVSKNCTGASFCKVTSTQSNPNASGITATWTLNQSETLITLTFDAGSLDELPEEITSQITSGRFTVEESFTFPTEIVTLLNAMDAITIREGSYTVNHSGNNYTIQFPL